MNTILATVTFLDAALNRFLHPASDAWVWLTGQGSQRLAALALHVSLSLGWTATFLDLHRHATYWGVTWALLNAAASVWIWWWLLRVYAVLSDDTQEVLPVEATVLLVWRMALNPMIVGLIAMGGGPIKVLSNVTLLISLHAATHFRSSGRGLLGRAADNNRQVLAVFRLRSGEIR